MQPITNTSSERTCSQRRSLFRRCEVGDPHTHTTLGLFLYSIFYYTTGHSHLAHYQDYASKYDLCASRTRATTHGLCSPDKHRGCSRLSREYSKSGSTHCQARVRGRMGVSIDLQWRYPLKLPDRKYPMISQYAQHTLTV